MLVERSRTENALNRLLVPFRSHKSLSKTFCQRMGKYNVLPGTVALIIQQQKGLQELTDEMLFWLLKETIDIISSNDDLHTLTSGVKVEKFFTPKEIKLYSESSIPKEDRKQFPITFEPVIQIADDQWYAVCDISKIIRLRDTQVITYNRRTQREMTIQERRGREPLFKINVNEKSVSEIKNLMLSGHYIPHPITLNMNLDKGTVMNYDAKRFSLTIESGQIDIIDGYHNYLAMTRAKDESSDFEYSCPVNIMFFSESKAGLYVAQEDKKNKINKSYIESLDTTKKGNLVVKKLSEDNESLIGNYIDRHKGIINYTELVDNIKYNWDIKTSMDEILLYNKLKQYFNAFVMNNQEIFKQPISFKQICILVRTIKYCDDNNYSMNDASNLMINTIAHSDEIDNKKYVAKLVKKTLFKDIDELIERSVSNV